MFKLIKYLKDYKRQCILAPFFKMTEAVFELIVPLVMAKIIDVGIKNGDTHYVAKMAGVMVGLGIIGLTVALIAQFFAAQASQGFGTVLRNDVFSHIQSLSNTELEKLGAPTLITRITNDINQLQVCVAMTLRIFLRAPFLVVGAMIMSFAIDFKLSLIFLVATPAIALVMYMVTSRTIPYFKRLQKTLDRVSMITRENLTGSRVIRAFSKQDYEKKRFDEINQELKDTAIRAGRISALLNPLTYVIMNTAIILIIWFGGKRVFYGGLTRGEVIALVNYMTQILFAMIAAANLVVIYTKSAASASRVNEVMDLKSTITETEVAEVPLSDTPKIEFRNVSFSYADSGEPSLSNISVMINNGETVGIIGGTGSGKSTLVSLIPRLYDVTAGELLIDGVNVKSYSFKQLRSQIGIVQQKAVLFSGTIRENMKFGCPDATDEQIFKALETAQAKEFVDSMAEGLDKQILQKGRNLSGGQKQRLTIARALVLKPQILILDDSASALDFATDAALRKAISACSEKMTVLIVSQRASSIKHADKIIVLDDGEIVGLGKHDELIESCEVYREICLSQLSPDEIHK